MKRRICALLLSVVMILPLFQYPGNDFIKEVSADENTSNSIAIDINGSENRTNLKSPEFLDWTLTGNNSPSTFKVGEIDFKLVSSAGNKFNKSENKALILNEGVPYLTCDGALINTKNTTLTLEITGLSAGIHTLTTWHNYYMSSKSALGKIGELAINIDGVEKATVIPSVQVSSDIEAGIAYMEFVVTENQPVIITIGRSANSTGYDMPILNAFEIDGTHPTRSIKNVIPEQNEGHHNPDEGLSWKSGDGAVAHDVYLGTDEYTVSIATTESEEYKGRQEETKYAFDEELSHMKTYYWRVDEINADGNIVKGKVYNFQVRHLAFPSAEGYGRFAKGGRGGQVIEVTTLEDNSEPGSLRYALEVAKGPRIVIFRVGGVIKLSKTLCIPDDGGNVYVAGQTAPGDGITLINHDFGAIGADDVIIRNMRVRVGDMNGHSTGGMGVASCDNTIVDHCSISWATDEGFSSRGAKNITFQRNIIAESLHDSVHYAPGAAGSRPEGTSPHSFAASISGDIGNFHHNLLVNCTGRNWSLAGGLLDDGKTYAGYLDITNNVVYNFRNRTTDGGVKRINFVNNYYKHGAVSRDMPVFSIGGDELNSGDMQMAYVAGNKMVDINGKVLLDPSDNAWETGYAIGEFNSIEEVRSDTPFFESFVNTQTADEAYEDVVKNVGAMVPAWDYLDSRYIDETINGTYTYRGSKQNLQGIIDSQNDVGGYPDETVFKHATVADDFDTDHDGMPNDWENAHGLNPDDVTDGSVITLSAEGYTNVEMYLNELMGESLVWADNAQPDESELPEETGTPTPEPTATETPVPTDTPVVYELGDVDANGKVDAADALLVLKHAAKIIELDEQQKLVADVTKDSNIDATDALDILKFAARIIDSF